MRAGGGVVHTTATADCDQADQMSERPLLQGGSLQEEAGYHTMQPSAAPCLDAHDHAHSHAHSARDGPALQHLTRQSRSDSSAPAESTSNLHVRMSLQGIKSPQGMAMVNPACPSSGYILKTSRNLLLGIQLAELQRYSSTNLYASIAALIFVAIEITLAVLNGLRAYFYTHPGTFPANEWERTFHFTEFWAVAFFNIVTGVVLLNSTSDTFYELALNWPTIIKRCALLNIVSAFVAAILITVDLPFFEPISHNIEYVATIFMILVDYILWLGLSSVKPTTSSSVKDNITPTQLLLLLLVLCIGVAMLVMFNTLPPPWNEFASHFLEFPTEIVAGMVVFYSAAESKRKADMAIFDLMYRTCDDAHDMAELRL